MMGQETTASAPDAAAQAQFQRAQELEQAGETEAAIDAYEAAITIDEDYIEAMFRCAYLLDLRGEDDRAMELYERCTTDSPVHVNALINLALSYEDQNMYEDAASCLRNVLQSYPNHERARPFLKDVESSRHMYYDEDMERATAQHSVVLDTPIADFELSVRSRNCLRKMSIFTLGDLLRVAEAELLAYKNFGETSLNEIKAMLTQKGLHLGQLAEPPPGGPPEPVRKVLVQGDPAVLNRPVSEMKLSVRARKCLQRLGITIIGELASRTENELMATKNFGVTSLNEIKQRLIDMGLGLRQPEF